MNQDNFNLKNPGRLFVVATPIGNLEDISLRALKVLKEVSVIACEDTRKTGLLLFHFNLRQNQKLIAFFEGNEEECIFKILKILESGQDVALVSNSGTPTIADPGFKLVKKAKELKIKVIPIPGASALLAALVSSGLPTNKFLFLGFLPKKKTRRQKYLRENLKPGLTTIIYLSPHRLSEELKDLKEIIGDQKVTLVRELTKIYEEIREAKINEFLKIYQEKKPQGEFTLVFCF